MVWNLVDDQRFQKLAVEGLGFSSVVWEAGAECVWGIAECYGVRLAESVFSSAPANSATAT